MEKARKVVEYYALCNKLKTIIRKGWISWNVQSERIESIAEHIYGTQMLALAMKSEYEYDVDIFKVIMMLAIHELGEIKIGDLTQFEINQDEKNHIEHIAYEEVLKDILDKDTIISLFEEFEAKETKEAQFAYLCDKLECDLQSKVYGESNCVDLNNQGNNPIMQTKIVKRLLDEGNSWSEMWLKFGQEIYPYDDHFKEVSNYVLKHTITVQED